MVEKGRIKEYEKVIRRAQKKLTTSGTEKYFDFKYEKGKFEIIEKKEEIKSTENLCGYYILETSETDMKAEDVELHYKELQKVERIFRDLKEHLDVRPVFHWKDRRVKTHIFLCIIAQTILGHTRKCLKQIKWFNNEENTLGRSLSNCRVIPIF
jgi:transposase